jgi:hypothetical protein
VKPFLTSKRKLIELGLLLGFGLILFFIWPGLEAVMLFTLGYVWNWTASQDLSAFFQGRAYRFSLLKMVVNLNFLFVLPFKKLPSITHIIPKSLPAGLFWFLVIIFAGSEMPWWATFIGSFVFELTQLDKIIFGNQAEKL